MTYIENHHKPPNPAALPSWVLIYFWETHGLATEMGPLKFQTVECSTPTYFMSKYCGPKAEHIYKDGNILRKPRIIMATVGLIQ